MSEIEPTYTEGTAFWSPTHTPLRFQVALMAMFRESETDTGWPEIDITDNGSMGDQHVTRGGVCRHIRAEVFWPWAAGLVGLTVVDRRAWHPATVVSLDEADGCNAETTEGLRVEAQQADGTTRTATLSVDDLWTELERLAGEAQP